MRHRAGAALCLALLLAAPGCGRKEALLTPRQDPPVIRLNAQRAPSTDAGLARHRVSWELESGSASHILYAINPPAGDVVDESWSQTRDRWISVAAPLRTSLAVSREEAATATNVVVRAVDGRGQMSAPARLSFVGDNIAPEVRILSPVPSDRFRAYLPPTVQIRWAGVDPDGEPQPVPVIFKWMLLGTETEVSFVVALSNPDSVRRFYEPGGYAGWDSTRATPGGESATTLSGLTPGANYIFAVVARDAAGTWNQVFSLNTNMLNFRCIPFESSGPLLTMYNESFYYQYAVPSYSADPRYEIPITVSSGLRVPIRWFGVPILGAEIEGYRWAFDLTDLTDQARPSRNGGPHRRWSPLNPATTSATVGPFRPGEIHRLFIEARDKNGLRSLGIVRIEVLEYSVQRPLLIVGDTRLNVDFRYPASLCMNPPVGRWPMAAELDSFLFARGGVPWRCYPTGTLSTPGIFAGYDFDTLGTRFYPGGIVPLSVLGRYQQVVWLTDALGAYNSGYPGHPGHPTTALRLMTAPGRQNTLAEYVRGGGRLWVAGGGAVNASMIQYDRPNNNTTNPAPGTTYSYLNWELVPGRFPYDLFGWRSEIKVTHSALSITRFLGRFDSTGTGSVYDGAPLAMRARTPASDPFPPGRTVNPGNFYFTSFDLEYLSQSNRLHNREEHGPNNGPEGSSLDTLYRATGSSLMPPQFNRYNVAMTRYHGAFKHNPVIFTGFDLWSFQRADCKALADFVLQRLWGLSPTRGQGLARAES